METEIYPAEALLINTLKMRFLSADDWVTAEHVFNAIEFLHFAKQLVGINIEEYRFVQLLETIPFVPVLNENNSKYYYLLNSQ